MTETYQVGPLVLDTQTCLVVRDGAPIALGKRAVAVLTALVESAPQFVSKTRIIEAAWPGLVVEEGNVAVQISSIRHALAQVSGGEDWVETLAGRGYRFVGPVTRLPEGTASVAEAHPRTNLPEPLTSFVGRERELAELERLLSTSRLLTLAGTGGVGKTRLALRVAERAVHGYGDGAWLVELAALRDPDLVSQAAITALGLKEQPGKPMLQTLTEHLRPMRLLLMLDNAEHLLAPCAQLADAVLRQCAGVTIVVTSREPLGVPGEVVYRVPPLSVPDAQRGGTLQGAMDSESVRLFSERVKLHQFTVGDRNIAVIADICRRLDGIALAIELAAARVRSMSVEDIDQRLDQRFMLLTGGARTLPPRQQTLRAAIDWSYELLSDTEKTLFRATSVFAGGFTLEAAEQVCAGDDVAAEGMLDLLTSLVDKSLLVPEQRVAATRYRLLDTVHAYATEQSRMHPDEGRWHARHLTHFFALAEAAEPQLTGSDQRKWLDRLETEHDNMRAALAHSMGSGGDPEAGLRLASALSRFWLVRGYLAEGRGWLSKLLEVTPGVDAVTRAKALNWAGILAWKQGDYGAAKASYAGCLAIRRQLGDRKGIGAVLNNQGLLAYEQGDYRAARTLHEESLAIDREQGDRWGVAVSLIHLASLAMMQGDYVSARSLNEESLAIFRAFGDRGHIANALRSLGNLHSHEGDDEAARGLYDESLSICRELRDRSGMAGALHGLGLTAHPMGEPSPACELLEESLAIYRELGDREGIARALNSLARAIAAHGHHPAARMRARESLTIYRELGDRSGIASAIEGLAAIASASGEPGEAARLWGASERLREEIEAPMAPNERAGYERAVASARAAFAADAKFDAAWGEGRAVTLDRLIDRALDKEAPR